MQKQLLHFKQQYKSIQWTETQLTSVLYDLMDRLNFPQHLPQQQQLPPSITHQWTDNAATSFKNNGSPQNGGRA